MLRESGVVKKSVVEDGSTVYFMEDCAERKPQEQKTQPAEGTEGATKSEIASYSRE